MISKVVIRERSCNKIHANKYTKKVKNRMQLAGTAPPPLNGLGGGGIDLQNVGSWGGGGEELLNGECWVNISALCNVKALWFVTRDSQNRELFGTI